MGLFHPGLDKFPEVFYNNSERKQKTQMETVALRRKAQRAGDGGRPAQVPQKVKIPPELQVEPRRRQ